MALAAAIFDLDGTLVDSLQDIASSMNHALTEFGLDTHPVESYRGFIGSGIEVLAERASARRADVPELVRTFRAHYNGAPVRSTRPYRGIMELIAGLRSSGVALAVLSNKPHEITVRIVDEVFDRRPFLQVFGHRKDVARKPDPYSALEIASAIDVLPRDVAFVGDTAVDMECARRAGMMAVGVSWGFRPAELTGAGAHTVVERADEIHALFQP